MYLHIRAHVHIKIHIHIRIYIHIHMHVHIRAHTCTHTHIHTHTHTHTHTRTRTHTERQCMVYTCTSLSTGPIRASADLVGHYVCFEVSKVIVLNAGLCVLATRAVACSLPPLRCYVLAAGYSSIVASYWLFPASCLLGYMLI
jgi:hypothetical protein